MSISRGSEELQTSAAVQLFDIQAHKSPIDWNENLMERNPAALVALGSLEL